jgi:hypothetical protein
MAAPNAQPAGSRPGPKAPHTHAPHEGGMPAGAKDVGTKLTPGHTKGIVTKPVGGKNTNKLH